MNMLNKYSHFFWEDNKAQCETLIQSHLNRKFIPSRRKENIPFQVTAVLCWVKSGNTEDDKEAQQQTLKLLLPFNAFILFYLFGQLTQYQQLICQHINQETIKIPPFLLAAYLHTPNAYTSTQLNCSLMMSFCPLCFSRQWRGPCRGHVSATGCQEAAQLRPAGCSCQNSERWGTTWRRNTTGPWRWISSEELVTAQPAGGPLLRPSAPSLARSWSTSKTPQITAWKTAPWACRAQRAVSASRKARAWANGRSGAARGCVGSVGWL